MGKILEKVANKMSNYATVIATVGPSYVISANNAAVREMLIRFINYSNKKKYLLDLFTSYRNTIKKLSIAIIVFVALFWIGVIGIVFEVIPMVALMAIGAAGHLFVLYPWTWKKIGRILKFQEVFEKMLEDNAKNPEEASMFGKPNALLVLSPLIPGLSFLACKALSTNIAIVKNVQFDSDDINEYVDQQQYANVDLANNQLHQQDLVANNSLALSLKKQNLIKENTIKFFVATKNDKPLIQVIGNQIDEETVEVKFFKLSEYISDNDYGDITVEQIIKDGFNNFYNFNLPKQTIESLGVLHFQHILNNAIGSEYQETNFNPTFEKYTLQNDSDFPSCITYTFKKDKNLIIDNESTDIGKRFLFSLINYFSIVYNNVNDSILFKTNNQYVNKLLAEHKLLYGKNIPYNKYSELSKDILPWTDDGRLYTKQKQVANNVQQHNQQHYQNNQVNVNNNQNKFNPKKLLWIIPVCLLPQVVVIVTALWLSGIF